MHMHVQLKLLLLLYYCWCCQSCADASSTLVVLCWNDWCPLSWCLAAWQVVICAYWQC
jgi:hypothetical protein